MLFHVSTSFIIVTLLPSVSPSCAVSARYGSNEAAWPQKPRLSQFVNSGYYTSHRPLLPVQLREAPSTSPTASASNLWKNHGVSNRIMAANDESLPISMGFFPHGLPSPDLPLLPSLVAWADPELLVLVHQLPQTHSWFLKYVAMFFSKLSLLGFADYVLSWSI